MRKPGLRGHVQLAANARSDLVVFHAVIGLLENGTLTAPARKSAERIIKICSMEAARRLRAFDKHAHLAEKTAAASKRSRRAP